MASRFPRPNTFVRKNPHFNPKTNNYWVVSRGIEVGVVHSWCVRFGSDSVGNFELTLTCRAAAARLTKLNRKDWIPYAQVDAFVNLKDAVELYADRYRGVGGSLCYLPVPDNQDQEWLAQLGSEFEGFTEDEIAMMELEEGLEGVSVG